MATETPDFVDDSALKEFSPIDARITELKTLATKYETLVIENPLDKEEIKKVHEARMELRDIRIDTTKAGKALRADATKFSKWVIEQEKKLIAEIEPTEKYLEKIQKEAQEIQEIEKRKKNLEENRESINGIFSHLKDSEMLSVYNAASLEKGGMGLIVEDEKILSIIQKNIPETIEKRMKLFSFWNTKIANIILTAQNTESLDVKVENPQAPQFFDGMNLKNVAEIFDCLGTFDTKKKELEDRAEKELEEKKRLEEIEAREKKMKDKEDANAAKIAQLESENLQKESSLHLEKISNMTSDEELNQYEKVEVSEKLKGDISQSILARKSDLQRIAKEKADAVDAERKKAEAKASQLFEKEVQKHIDIIQTATEPMVDTYFNQFNEDTDTIIISRLKASLNIRKEEIIAEKSKIEKSRKMKKFLKDNDFDEKTDVWKESDKKVTLWRKIGELAL